MKTYFKKTIEQIFQVVSGNKKFNAHKKTKPRKIETILLKEDSDLAEQVTRYIGQLCGKDLFLKTLVDTEFNFHLREAVGILSDAYETCKSVLALDWDKPSSQHLITSSQILGHEKEFAQSYNACIDIAQTLTEGQDRSYRLVGELNELLNYFGHKLVRMRTLRNELSTYFYMENLVTGLPLSDSADAFFESASQKSLAILQDLESRASCKKYKGTVELKALALKAGISGIPKTALDTLSDNISPKFLLDSIVPYNHEINGKQYSKVVTFLYHLENSENTPEVKEYLERSLLSSKYTASDLINFTSENIDNCTKNTLSLYTLKNNILHIQSLILAEYLVTHNEDEGIIYAKELVDKYDKLSFFQEDDFYEICAVYLYISENPIHNNEPIEKYIDLMCRRLKKNTDNKYWLIDAQTIMHNFYRLRDIVGEISDLDAPTCIDVYDEDITEITQNIYKLSAKITDNINATNSISIMALLAIHHLVVWTKSYLRMVVNSTCVYDDDHSGLPQGLQAAYQNALDYILEVFDNRGLFRNYVTSLVHTSGEQRNNTLDKLRFLAADIAIGACPASIVDFIELSYLEASDTYRYLCSDGEGLNDAYYTAMRWIHDNEIISSMQFNTYHERSAAEELIYTHFEKAKLILTPEKLNNKTLFELNEILTK